MNKYRVYVHVFPNGKKYVGITCQEPITKRWGGGSGYRKCPKVYRAIQHYGWQNIEHLVVAEDLTKDEAEALEIALIKAYDSVKNGYNIEYGGNTIGTHSEETKRKISEGNKGKSKPCTPERREKARQQGLTNNPFKGKRHSEMSLEKMRAIKMGNQYAKGLKHTEEFKEWKSRQMHEKYKDGGNPRCKEVVMINPSGIETVFYSLRQAARTVNIPLSQMHKRVKEGIVVNGYQWKYRETET